MSQLAQRINEAFDRIAKNEGFIERPSQRQLALLIGDLIEGKTTGSFEAPTGLGKSLATLIPALLASQELGKRVAIATYTNVLTEQYWFKDLPLALAATDLEGIIRPHLLMGKARYLCEAELMEENPQLALKVRANVRHGIYTEFANVNGLKASETRTIWPKVQSPSVCPVKACPFFDDCYYYNARKRAEEAPLIITNHAVLLQHALQTHLSNEGRGMMGELDFVIIDEAHDLYAAALGAFEFELNPGKLSQILGLAARVTKEFQNYLPSSTHKKLQDAQKRLEKAFDKGFAMLDNIPFDQEKLGIYGASPKELSEDPFFAKTRNEPLVIHVNTLRELISDECLSWMISANKSLDQIENVATAQMDSWRTYIQMVHEFGLHVEYLKEPAGIGVSYAALSGNTGMVRSDVVDPAPILQDILWSKIPSVCLSATLCIDEEFDYFNRRVGQKADYEEMLPSVFDYPNQMSVYLPKAGKIPDPTQARAEGQQQGYYFAVADEINKLIEAFGGRTLVLFHSRKEMEGVYAVMSKKDEFPILIQAKGTNSNIGDRFKKNPATSLFGLRSYWTGFDAPGNTLSCLVIVRLPFEVPVEPATIARSVYMTQQGQNPFRDHSIPQAKLMVRQGIGRLIRQDSDRGVVALLDPRMRTRQYGEEFLLNFPVGVQSFDDIWEAMAHVGIAGNSDQLL